MKSRAAYGALAGSLSPAQIQREAIRVLRSNLQAAISDLENPIAAPGADLRGCGCGVAGDTPAALALARRLATDLGMEPIDIADADRGAYHAAASIASNFLLTLEAAAESVAGGAGIAAEDARRLLGPLVRTTVENWLAAGPRAALTGPVARGDEQTVAAQRAAVAATAPDLLALFDEMVERTGALAEHRPLEVVA